MISLVKPALYSGEMKEKLADHDPYSDLDVRADRIKQWHPLNQSLYAGYKIMLPGMLLLSKGDRIAMNASVETRYPYLDEDVIAFCAGIAPEYKLRGMTEKWILRQVAARILPQKIANRPKTMFRASMAGTFLGSHRPLWVDQLLSRESLAATGYLRPGDDCAAAGMANTNSTDHACTVRLRRGADRAWSRPSSGITSFVVAACASFRPGRPRAAGMQCARRA